MTATTSSARLPDGTTAPRPAPGSWLTETVNARTGVIRASGHLTPQGADLLSGTAEHLRGSGHSRVTLDLRDVQAADDAGLHVLRTLSSAFEASGDTLLIRNAPDRSSGRA